MKALLQGKDKSFKKLKTANLSMKETHENEKVKQHYKELYDSIKITLAKHIEQTTALLTENENLKAQIHENLKCNTMESIKPSVLAPDLLSGIGSGCSKHMTGDRSWLRNFMKKFIGTVRFGNDIFGAIMGYGDYVIVAFRKHSFYVRDTDGVELIKGSRGSNLYTILVEEIMKSSPIFLLSKASKNKSWLWHRRLNHLNFGIINDLARKDLVRGYLIEFEKDICVLLIFSPIMTVPRTPQQYRRCRKTEPRTSWRRARRTMLSFPRLGVFIGRSCGATCFTTKSCTHSFYTIDHDALLQVIHRHLQAITISKFNKALQLNLLYEDNLCLLTIIFINYARIEIYEFVDLLVCEGYLNQTVSCYCSQVDFTKLNLMSRLHVSRYSYLHRQCRQYKLDPYQMDVKIAFSNGKLKREVYV
ncbi:integrase, catalytic region, zinc finger, CCHC-type containing protein [Tanacetum coccineum]